MKFGMHVKNVGSRNTDPNFPVSTKRVNDKSKVFSVWTDYIFYSSYKTIIISDNL